MELEIKGDKL